MCREKIPVSRGIDEILKEYIRCSDIVNVFYDTKKKTIPPHILARKAEIGTRVHSAIAEYTMMNTVSDCLEETDYGYFESWREWYEKSETLGITKELQHIETRLYDSKRMITGCVDAVLKKEGKLYLIDWKTSVAIDRLTWPVKAALYVQLIRRNELCNIEDEVCFLKLAKDGSEATEVWFKMSEFHYEVANWAVEAYER